jgi:two-component system, NarL family, invasion response regulator UvrY
MKKRIIVIDDEPLIATLLKELIDEDEELEVAKVATKKDEFLQAVAADRYDIALIDISVGEREGGLELLAAIKSRGIKLPAITLSAHDEADYAIKCLKAGAGGYVNKNSICADLIRGIKAVLSGQLFVSGDKGDYILRQYKKSAAPVV